MSSSYTSRRTYLLNRAAWGLAGFALLYLIFGSEYKWAIAIGCAVLAALCWLIAGSIEKKRRSQNNRFTDEDGNARPNKL